MRVTEDDLLEEVKKLKEEIEWAADILDSIKFELSSRAYSVDDEEFEKVFFARDRLQMALKKN